MRIGFALLAEPLLGGDALWWSFPVGSLATLAMAAAYYRWGDWRRTTLRVPPSVDEVEEEALATSEPGGRMQPTG